MEKEQYLKGVNKLELELADLRKKRKTLDANYILFTSPCKTGDKVKLNQLDGTNEVVFVKSIKINMHGNLNYKFFKCKKDGTPSKQESWTWRFKSLEILNS